MPSATASTSRPDCVSTRLRPRRSNSVAPNAFSRSVMRRDTVVRLTPRRSAAFGSESVVASARKCCRFDQSNIGSNIGQGSSRSSAKTQTSRDHNAVSVHAAVQECSSAAQICTLNALRESRLSLRRRAPPGGIGLGPVAVEQPPAVAGEHFVGDREQWRRLTAERGCRRRRRIAPQTQRRSAPDVAGGSWSARPIVRANAGSGSRR